MPRGIKGSGPKKAPKARTGRKALMAGLTAIVTAPTPKGRGRPRAAKAMTGIAPAPMAAIGKVRGRKVRKARKVRTAKAASTTVNGQMGSSALLGGTLSPKVAYGAIGTALAVAMTGLLALPADARNLSAQQTIDLLLGTENVEFFSSHTSLQSLLTAQRLLIASGYSSWGDYVKEKPAAAIMALTQAGITAPAFTG